jgi:RNA polymerase sigma-70 factor (ECF subfamily)
MNARTLESAQRLYVQVLVLRCQTGDNAAFAEIVERYHERLTCHVRRLVDHPCEPDEILQNVWLTVYRKLARLSNPRCSTTWLYRVARNAALAEMRRRIRRVEFCQTVAAETQTGVDLAITTEDMDRLHVAVDSLPPEQREVVTLRFLEEMSYEGIAGVVGCPIGTVRSRLHYARELLNRELGGEP